MDYLDGIILPISNRRNVYQIPPQMVSAWVRAFKLVLESNTEQKETANV